MSWSVKEMVKELKIHMPDGSITKSIIAALKAGQEMRNGIDVDDTGVYATDHNTLEDGAEAWDKAVKEKV